MRAARRALLRTSAMLAASAAPRRRRPDVGEQEGRHRLGGHPRRVGRGERLHDMRRHLACRDLGLGRDRVGDELPPRQAEPRPHAVGARDGGRVVEAERARKPRVARPEGRQRVLPEGDHRHAPGLEHLQRLRQVEDRLGPARHHRHRGLRQLLEIGRDVEARLGAAMHPADAAGGEDLDPRQPRADHRRGHGRRARPPLGQGHGEVGPRQLADVAPSPAPSPAPRVPPARARPGSRRRRPRASPGRPRRPGPRPRRRGRSRGWRGRASRGSRSSIRARPAGRRPAIASATSVAKVRGGVMLPRG